MMIFMDPPPHDRLRRLVSRAFTPRRVMALEGRARELCAQLLDPLLDARAFDYLDDFAARIPSTLIGALLGVPEADQDQVRRWADLMLEYEPDGISAERREGIRKLRDYLGDMVEARRRAPQDDMVSDLLASEITLEDGETRRLEHREVMAFFTMLLIAGSETTARLLGWAAVLLARHPDQRARLVGEREMIPNAVEELLRYEAPSPIQARYVRRDVEWHGRQVPAGSKIALLTGSAGRDERKYPDPDRFDVTRTFDTHVSLGYGIHYCLGANLARLEARVVLEETLARLPEWDVDESAIELVRTTTVRGPSKVPISW
jgi:cytochrome P450